MRSREADLISVVTEQSQGIRSILNTVRYELLKEQWREQPGDKWTSSTQIVGLRTRMESQMNLRLFANIQLS